MRSLLHKTFNHQNDPGRSTAVSVDGKSSMVNMDSSASRESHVGYHKDVSRQDVSVRRIGMNGRPLQDQMKTREPVEDVHFGNRNSSNDEDANHKTSSVLCKLLQQQAAPEVDIDCFDGNPLNYHYFMALFCEVVETKIEDPRGRLTRLLKYTVGEAKELIKHCIQLPHDKGYKYAKSLLEKTYGNPHKILSSYRKEVKDWPQVKFGDAKAFRKFFNFLLKCESVSDNQHWNALDTPEILCMLISKLPGVLMDRWNRKVQNIRRRESREPDLIDFVQFVEEETLLMNDPLFSREALCEYAGQKEKEGKAKHKKLKNCYTKSEEKVTQNYSSVNPRKKCVFCDGSHDLDDCQFYTEIPVEERSKFLKENKLCYGCYEEISTQHTARSCKNRRTCKICKEKHPTGLHGFTFKRKSKSSNDGTDSNDPTVKSNCAGVGCATATFGQVISMCVVPVRVKHSDSDKEVKTFALLDTCSQGTFVTEDLISKLGVSGVKTSINIKTLNGNQKQSSSLVQGLMVSAPITLSSNQIHWIKLPKSFTRKEIPVDPVEIPTPIKLRKWKYLDKVAKHLATDDEVSVDLLIGANCVQALEPVDVISSQCGGPYAFCTILGWCIVGPIEDRIGSHGTVSCNHVKSC